MKLNKLILGVLFFSFFFLLILIPNGSAEENTENRIDGFFDIKLSSGTELIVNISIDVNKLTLSASNVTYSKQEINDFSDSKPELMGAIKYALKSMLTDQIKQTFVNSYVFSVNELPKYKNGMFYDNYIINLKSLYFKMNNSVNINEIINGLLDVGAYINYSFDLKAELGWNNYYTFILNERIGYQRTTGSVTGDRIKWIVENEDSEHPSLLAEITIKNNNPTTSNIKNEKIDLQYNLDCRAGNKTKFSTNIMIKSVNISNFNILPEFVYNLNIMPSDGIRLFTNNNLLTYEEIFRKTVEPIENNIISIVENSSFNQKLNSFINWDLNTTINCTNPYNITYMDSNPPLTIVLIDKNINLKLCGISSKAFFGLINAGAEVNISEEDINFGDKLNEIGYPYNISIFLPNNIYLNSENVYVWNENNSLKGEFKSDIANIYNNEKINTTIEIEIKSSDLNILSFFTGGTELGFNLYLIETQNRSVTSLPKYLNLPEKIFLHFFNSDAFRLCYEDKVFSNESINLFLESEKDNFERRITSILLDSDQAIEGSLDKNKFYDSLIWDGDINDIDGNDPIKIVTYSYSTYAIPFEFSFIAPKFELSNKILNFTGIKNQNVKYKIIFPQGVDIKVNDTLDKVIVNKTQDNRYIIELNFNENESGLIDSVSFKIDPSFIFLLTIFIPCILSMFIAIILVTIIYFIRKKRKRGKGILNNEKYKKSEKIEEQDYYIPPPPPS